MMATVTHEHAVRLARTGASGTQRVTDRVILTVASLAREHGGPSRTIPSLRAALQGAGVDAEIVTPTAKGGFGRALRARLESSAIQILHDNGVWLPSNHTAVRVAHAASIPVVISPRGMLEPWSMRHRACKKRLAWWMYQHRDLNTASLIHATSPDEAAHVRALGFRQPIAIIANGVDVPELRWRHNARSERVVLFLSRVHPKKGLLNLVRAWSAVRPRGWRVVIAGPDEDGHTREVRTAAVRAGVGASFEFIGAVDGDAKLRLLQNADLFVLPTYSENFGVVVAEALANGVPVITTTGTPWSALHTERCGWWVEVGVDPLVDALALATALPDAERNMMGVRGRERVRRHFAWPRIGEDMGAVYSWLVSGGATPASVTVA